MVVASLMAMMTAVVVAVLKGTGRKRREAEMKRGEGDEVMWWRLWPY